MLAAIVPTREFLLVVDPYVLEILLVNPLFAAVTLISDLAALAPPVTIHLVLPDYLATNYQRTLAGDVAEARMVMLTVFANEGIVPSLTLSQDLPRRLRERIRRGAEGDCRGLRLLALADHLKADGIMTSLQSLVEARLDLLRHHRFRIVPPEELPDFVEVCGRGHGVPCTALPGAPNHLPSGVLYQFTHWKARRLSSWFNKVSQSLSTDEPLRELLRSALLNRYPFIVRARDSILFYRIQADRYIRHHGHEMRVFREPLNYHLTIFYIHIWGMLDTLAQLANRRLGLGVDPFHCHINRHDFLSALGEKHPTLRWFVGTHGAQWVPIIGDVRHPVAHSALRLQTDLLTDTVQSKKSDKEIAAILREEDPDFYRALPADVIEEWEPVAIYNWRINKMAVVSDDVINVDRPEGGYFRHPVASIDFDVERVNAFIDAFLVGCFGSTPPVAEPVRPPPLATSWWSRASTRILRTVWPASSTRHRCRNQGRGSARTALSLPKRRSFDSPEAMDG